MIERTWGDRMGRITRVCVLALMAVAPGGAMGQARDSIPGVQLGLLYENSYTPAIAVKPFTGRFGGS